MATRRMKTYDLYWSPTGQKIASGVRASTMKSAKRQAPTPYRTYNKGEIYAVQTSENPPGSYRKTKKAVRGFQRSGLLDPGPMFRKSRRIAGRSKTGKRASGTRRNPKISDATMVKLPVKALKKLVRAVKRGERAIVKARKV